jgi:hypothetical protein
LEDLGLKGMTGDAYIPIPVVADLQAPPELIPDRVVSRSDQAASLGPTGITQLVRDICLVDQAMGDGIERVVECGYPIINKLRGGASLP